jgi:Uma2 family endonuclease
MSTMLVFGPADHGRTVTREEWETALRQEGYRYEVIDGRLVVSPRPNFPHDAVVEWLHDVLKAYARRHPEVMNWVSGRAGVSVLDRPELTEPEPDIAAFRDVPLDLPYDEIRWEDLSPLLVVEVVSEDNAEKDLERNVELYLEVPSIREYWILDPRQDADRPTLHVYRRRGQRWQKRIDIAPGGTYTTRLLPDFALMVDPRAANEQG